MSEPLRIGTERRWGETTCGFGIDAPACDAPATTHVMWLETLAVSNTCEEHMRFICQNAAMPYETHTFGSNCGMPGALWHHPYEDETEGYCMFPAPDDVSLLASEPLPAALSSP